jgi:hypothetical protein
MHVRLYKNKPVTIQENDCQHHAVLTKCVIREKYREMWKVHIQETNQEDVQWFPLTVPDTQ